jgi:hypothetical protein
MVNDWPAVHRADETLFTIASILARTGLDHGRRIDAAISQVRPWLHDLERSIA